MRSNTRWRIGLLVAISAISLSVSAKAQDFLSNYDFSQGNLNAAKGQPLSPEGGVNVSVGTSDSFGLPNVGDAPASVIQIPKTDIGQGVRLPGPTLPNGGGTGAVNDWTLFIDILFPAESSGKKRSVLEIIGPEFVANGADAEVLVDAQNKIGFKDFTGGEIKPDTWHRIAFVVDYFFNSEARVYVDGTRVARVPLPEGQPDGVWALDTGFFPGSINGALLFNDDTAETELGYISAIQLRDAPLTDGQVFAMGTASSDGIPETIPPIPSFIDAWLPSGDFASRDAEIGAIISTGTTTVNNSSISLTLDGESVTPRISRETGVDGQLISVLYKPSALFDAAQDHVLTLTYSDSNEGEKTLTKEFRVPIYYEDFSSLELGPNINEGAAGAEVYTKVPPSGWTVDDSDVPGVVTKSTFDSNGLNRDNDLTDDTLDGVTEWAGWSFADLDWWVEAAGDQNRSQFTKAQGTVMIADPDEWDDAPHAGSGKNTEERTAIDPETGYDLWYDTLVSSGDISLEGVPAGSAFLTFDSSWRPEYDGNYRQSGEVLVSFDGGDDVQLLNWVSDPNSPNFHPDATNESILLLLNNPAGAQSMTLKFRMYDAGNDWWWAIDNVVVDGGDQVPPPVVLAHPVSAEVSAGQSASFAVEASGDNLVYQWFQGATEIAGANEATLVIENVSIEDAGSYYASVSNPGGEAVSNSANLKVLLPLGTYTLFAEDFDGLTLGPAVDEAVGGETVWTKTAPEGWTIDDTLVPGAGDPDNDGVTEWAGWSFADPSFWASAGGQARSEFTKGEGAVAIADGDEWDDAAHLPGQMETLLITPAIDISGIIPGSLVFKLDSSWRDENPQRGWIHVSIDGAEPTELAVLDSDPGSPNYKSAALNETLTYAIDAPANASTVQLTFGYQAGNNWWWAIDNLALTADLAPFFEEGFDGVTLGTSVDETVGDAPVENAWSKQGPDGWTTDDSGVPDFETVGVGVTEWKGWSFADPSFWDAVAGQSRGDFTKGSGVVVIADGDEWADLGDPAQGDTRPMVTVLNTPAVSIAGYAENTVALRFDSSWRQETPQKAWLSVSFDGGESIELLRWNSEGGSPNFKESNLNETIMVSIPNPEGADSMVVSFGYEGVNDWWWAIDNISFFQADAPPPTGIEVAVHPESVNVDEGTTLTLVSKFDSEIAYTVQWFLSGADGDVAIEGATSETLVVDAITPDWAGGYYAKAVNEAGREATTVVADVSVNLAPGIIELLFEDFNSLELGPSVDETIDGAIVENAWTDVPPSGWNVDDSGVPDLDTAGVGVTEWKGWSFADPAFWNEVAGQSRSDFTLGTGIIAIADGDEWDDLGSAAQGDSRPMVTVLETPSISLDSIVADTVVLELDSSWRQETPQKAWIHVAFDGGEQMVVASYESDAGDNFKETNLNEHLSFAVANPEGASSMVVYFGYEGVNDWWWAIDNIRVTGDPVALFAEDFDSLVLGPSVDETDSQGNLIPNAWTNSAPEGWVVDDSGVPDLDTAGVGVTEWKGWSFADPAFWDGVAGQSRSDFTKGRNVIAIADGDEWDDLGSAAQGDSRPMVTLLSTPEIALDAVGGGEVRLRFDSSWRQETPQKGWVSASYDGGESVDVIRFNSESGDPGFKESNLNETIELVLDVPGDASSVVITFGYEGVNDWWWAIDNIVVYVAEPQAPSVMAGRDADGNIVISWDGAAQLQVAPTPAGPWETLEASSPAAFDPAGKPSAGSPDSAAYFFRLIEE